MAHVLRSVLDVKRGVFVGAIFAAAIFVPAASRAAERDRAREEQAPALDVGVLAGVGFPRPLTLEAVVGLGDTVLFGAEYGFLPKTTLGSVDASLWGAAVNGRWFPFHGAFFVGLRAGYQHATATASFSADGFGTYADSLEVGTWFLNPRVGFLWQWKPVALGIDAGVQLPIASNVTRPTLLPITDPATSSNIENATYAMGRGVVPTVDLLKVGLVF